MYASVNVRPSPSTQQQFAEQVTRQSTLRNRCLYFLSSQKMWS